MQEGRNAGRNEGRMGKREKGGWKAGGRKKGYNRRTGKEVDRIGSA